MILSIVLPVYNVENYIERCLISIVSQNFLNDNYEIIIVDDGSNDNSANICEKYRLEYKNIKIIFQENKGLSGARNTGLINAVGKYIWFIDSDDSIIENSLSEIIAYIKLFNPIIFNFSFEMIYNNNSIEKFFLDKNLKEEYGKYDHKFLSKKQIIYKPMIWSYIYEKAFLINNNLFFYEGILHEDEEFSIRALYFAEEVYYTNNVYYSYFENSNSIMGSFKKISSFDKFRIIENYKKFIIINNINGAYLDFIKFRVVVLILTVLDSKNFFKHDFVDQKEIINKIKNMYFYPLSVFSNMSLKHRIYIYIINISPYLYLNFRKLK